MMKTPVLTKYFFRRNVFAISIVWLALTLFLLSLEILRRADDDGMAHGFLVGALHAPLLAMDALPFACAIGIAAVMRKMAVSGEMSALRIAGLSPTRLIGLNVVAATAFAAAHFLIGETLAPIGAEKANSLRGASPTRALWLRDGEDYIRINRLRRNGDMDDIVIYHVADSNLRSVTRADSARHGDSGWRLQNVRVRRLDGENGGGEETTWTLPAEPSSFAAFFQKPRDMSTTAALAAALELSAAGQDARELWEKLWRQLEILAAMPLFAAAAVWLLGGGGARYASSVAAAALLAGTYYLCAEIAARAAIFLGSPLLLAAPPLAMLAVIVAGARRANRV